MAVLLNMTSKRPEDNSEVTKTLGYVNPNVSNTDAASFITALNGLSKNTLTDIEKVSKEKINFTQEGE